MGVKYSRAVIFIRSEYINVDEDLEVFETCVRSFLLSCAPSARSRQVHSLPREVAMRLIPELVTAHLWAHSMGP